MKNALLITLGHNASAIFYNGVDKPIGYEEERLNREKSSSAFPIMAIQEILHHVDRSALFGAKLLISNWYDNFDLDNVEPRRYRKDIIDKLVLDFNMELIAVNADFTHHDAHMASSKAFLDCHQHGLDANNIDDNSEMHMMVIDGFGNNQEVISIYHQMCYSKGVQDVELLNRVFGYKNSLGLMYQFATAFCGMKENQDEYKFLGYESHIEEEMKVEGRLKVERLAANQVELFFARLEEEVEDVNPAKSFLNLDELDEARMHWNGIFRKVMIGMGIEGCEDYLRRVVIGTFIQKVIEDVCCKFIDIHGIKNVCLSGGCFYNVKLNNKILKHIEGVVSVVPVAGDQGAAIGLYEKYVGHFEFDDLCYGVRSLKTTKTIHHDRIIICHGKTDFADMVASLVEKNNIVNIVTGDMEFGPRALCHTTSLALPNQGNVDYINELNGRNTVMPMAPVMLHSKAGNLFGDESGMDRVIGSDRYMIITYDYVDQDIEDLGGVMHKYPHNGVYSGRPQIVSNADSTPICNILYRVDSPCLINTSFNTHGNPILFSLDQCIDDFLQQLRKDTENKNYLVIYDEKN